MTLFEENAAILRDLARDGSDLGPPRQIDFSHVFARLAAAEGFARDAEVEGFVASLEQVEEREDPWDVTVSKEMVPTCENITDAEEQLGALARRHGGRSDGWGFFRI